MPKYPDANSLVCSGHESKISSNKPMTCPSKHNQFLQLQKRQMQQMSLWPNRTTNYKQKLTSRKSTLMLSLPSFTSSKCKQQHNFMHWICRQWEMEDTTWHNATHAVVLAAVVEDLPPSKQHWWQHNPCRLATRPPTQAFPWHLCQPPTRANTGISTLFCTTQWQPVYQPYLATHYSYPATHVEWYNMFASPTASLTSTTAIKNQTIAKPNLLLDTWILCW